MEWWLHVKVTSCKKKKALIKQVFSQAEEFSPKQKKKKDCSPYEGKSGQSRNQVLKEAEEALSIHSSIELLHTLPIFQANL